MENGRRKSYKGAISDLLLGESDPDRLEVKITPKFIKKATGIYKPPKCPKCDTILLVEKFDEADGKDMSEGELAEYLAGTHGTMHCPKCDYSEDFED